MISATTWRGSLVDALVPGAPVPSASQTSTRAQARGVAILTLGALLLALSLWLDVRYLGHLATTPTCVLYVALGSAGLPVFADVSSPVTYGYLVGFALAALVVGWLAERGWDRRFVTAIAAMLLGEVAIYLGGVPWLAASFGWDFAFKQGLLPFLVGDALKLLAAALVLPAAWLLTGHAKRLEAKRLEALR